MCVFGANVNQTDTTNDTRNDKVEFTAAVTDIAAVYYEYWLFLINVRNFIKRAKAETLRICPSMCAYACLFVTEEQINSR